MDAARTKIPTPDVSMSITGTVEAGKGRSAGHMAEHPIPASVFGWPPVPGTLNVQVGRPIAALVSRLPGGTPVHDPNGDVAVYHRMLIGEVPVAVRAYRMSIEVVAPVKLRDHFRLNDGDPLLLEWEHQPEQLETLAAMAERATVR